MKAVTVSMMASRLCRCWRRANIRLRSCLKSLLRSLNLVAENTLQLKKLLL